MKNLHFNGKYKKERGLFKPLTISLARQLEAFTSAVPEGQIVEFFYEVQHDDGTLPQLAKLHAMIKQLATHVGETAENMKLLVKDKAGLCIAREVSGKEYFLAKSLAIQAAIEIGQDINYPVG